MKRDSDAPTLTALAVVPFVRRQRRPYRLRVTFPLTPSIKPAIRYYDDAETLQREYETYRRTIAAPADCTFTRERWSKISGCYVPFVPVASMEPAQ